jgi:hypothetical protein
MWRSYEEMREALSQRPDLDSLKQAFCLSTIAQRAVYPESFEPDTHWATVVVPSTEGESLLKAIGDSDLSRLALFGLFYHHDSLIDPVASDLSGIRQLIEDSILTGNILLPHITGRELYDKFNDEFSTNRTDHLDPPDVMRLLEGTPVGVFQVGALVTGPLGILESSEMRWIPPTAAPPLWHCSDTGCNALHRVWLRSGHRPLLDHYDRLQRAAIESSGLPSEWMAPLRTKLMRPDDRRAEILFADILPFLASCVVGEDRREVLLAVLSGDRRNEIRHRLELSPRGNEFTNLSAKDLSSRLTPEERLQLLAVQHTRELVQVTDDLILQRRLVVQPEELRRASIAPPTTSRRDLRTEMSSYGLRSPGRRPLIRLKTAIERAYRDIDEIEDLRWRVRASENVSTSAALSSFIEREGARTAVAELVTPERRVFETIASEVLFSASQDDTIEGRTTRILWKLGFNIPRYGGALSLLRRRLDEFNQCLLTLGSAESETDRESIRCSGVNPFVSLEDYLERLVGFNSWLCSCDHFVGTRFAYNRVDAVAAVPEVLGAPLQSGDATFSWNLSGDNTLGTSQVYLEKLLSWLSGLRDTDRTSLRRSEDQMPHYAHDRDQEFPFLHTQAWADFDQSEFDSYLGRLREIGEQVRKSQLTNIRNGLDHRRRDDRFPTVESMLAMVSRIHQAVAISDVHRLVPKRFWLQERTTDRYGRGTLVLQDYEGRSYSVSTPNPVVALPEIQFASPVIIGPGKFLCGGAVPIVFSVRSANEFSRYWSGYPRRRTIPPPKSSQTGETEDDANPDPLV